MVSYTLLSMVPNLFKTYLYTV